MNHHTRAHLCKMSQSEDEAVEDETEWRSSLVDSLSVSPGTSATGKVKAKGKHEVLEREVVLRDLVLCCGEILDTGLCLPAGCW